MKIIEIFTVITGILPYVLLVIGITNGKVKQSFATWMLWLVLDIIVLCGIIAQDGNSLLFFVFTLGTIVVTAVLVFKRQFSWGRFETFVTALVAICITVFLMGGPYIATIATTAALNIAGIPQLIATYKDPKTASAKAYFLFMTSSLLSVMGTEAWTVQDKLPQMSSAIYCLIVFLLALRK